MLPAIYVRNARGTQFINCGSIGQPFMDIADSENVRVIDCSAHDAEWALKANNAPGLVVDGFHGTRLDRAEYVSPIVSQFGARMLNQRVSMIALAQGIARV